MSNLVNKNNEQKTENFTETSFVGYETLAKDLLNAIAEKEFGYSFKSYVDVVNLRRTLLDNYGVDLATYGLDDNFATSLYLAGIRTDI